MRSIEFRVRSFVEIKAFVVILLLVQKCALADDENIVKATKSVIDEDEMEKMEREGAIRLMPPQMDEEESHSPHMPVKLRCDGCKVIAYKMAKRFNEAHERRPSMKSLTESEVIDIVDEICSDDFENYGIKEVNGVKRITGPGTETADAAGIMQGGGRWPLRLREMCNGYVGELEEFPIYQGYLQDKTLVRFLCEGSGIQGDCLDKKDRDEL